MMICTAEPNESSNTWADASQESVTLQDLKEQFKGTYGEKTGAIVDAFAKAFPDKKPAALMSMIGNHRQRSVMLADSKSKQEAPVFIWPGLVGNHPCLTIDCVLSIVWTFVSGFTIQIRCCRTRGGARPEGFVAKNGWGIAEIHENRRSQWCRFAQMA